MGTFRCVKWCQGVSNCVKLCLVYDKAVCTACQLFLGLGSADFQLVFTVAIILMEPPRCL